MEFLPYGWLEDALYYHKSNYWRQKKNNKYLPFVSRLPSGGNFLLFMLVCREPISQKKKISKRLASNVRD